VLNSLNSLLEFNYITSFLLLGILKSFVFLTGAKIWINYDTRRCLLCWTSPAMNICQLNATFILFWIKIGCTSIKESYRHLFLWTATGEDPRIKYFCQVLGWCKWPLTRAICTFTRCQWRSSNLFSLVIQGDTHTFELTNWLNKVRTLLWCCFSPNLGRKRYEMVSCIWPIFGISKSLEKVVFDFTWLVQKIINFFHSFSVNLVSVS